MRAKIITALCLSLAPGVAVAGPTLTADVTELELRPGRVALACEKHLAPPKPYLFALTRDHRAALLFGAPDGEDAAVHLLPTFVRDAVMHAEHLVHGEFSDREGFDRILAELTRAEESGREGPVVERLGDLAEDYLRYMSHVQIGANELSALTPLKANHYLVNLLTRSIRELSEQEAARAKKRDALIIRLDPPATEEELADFRNDLDLRLGISLLATAYGAEPIMLLPPGYARNEWENAATIEFTAELVRGLRTLERHPFRRQSANVGTWNQLNESQNRFLKLLPTQTEFYLQNIRLAAARVDELIRTHDGVLVNVDLSALLGRRGLVVMLERLGYRVERLDSPADWEAFKPAFATSKP